MSNPLNPLRSLTPLVVAIAILAGATASSVRAEDPDALAADQAELAQRFARLETLAKRIAELTEAEDPARAEQLRAAVRKSQEMELPDRFQAIVALLEREQLAAAANDQTAISEQLRVLLRLLLSDPNEARDEARRKQLKEMLKAINRHIRSQQELRNASPESDEGVLADRQKSLAEQVERLRKEAADPDGKKGMSGEAGEPADSASPREGQPSEDQPAKEQPAAPGQTPPQPGDPQQGSPQEGSPPGGQPQPGGQSSSGESQSPLERAAERLQAAQQRMLEAIEDLRESERDEAEPKQAEAQRRLEDARAEIEEALRQLREEEQQRRLTQLATRLRRMLAEQIDILALTEQTETDRPNRGQRATKLAAAGLANREEELVDVADGALRLLAEDGASIAYPEVIGQIREDMGHVARRLRETKLGAVTQRLEQDVIESLEETIEALDKTLQDMEQRKNQRQNQDQAGGSGDPQVVDKLAELRMIRAIQVQIKRRTGFWHDIWGEDPTQRDEARTALERLAERQAKLMRALRNLGRTDGT